MDTRYTKESETGNIYTCEAYECSTCSMDVLEEEDNEKTK